MESQIVETSYEGSTRQLKDAEESHKWFAPSLFVTNYGGWGFKFEAECYRYNLDGSISTASFNIDGPTKRYVGGKITPKKSCQLRQVPQERDKPICNRTCHTAFVNKNCVALSKSEMYEATKELFWKAWNEAHPNETLNILKCMKAWVL